MIGALPRLLTLREGVATLSQFDIEQFDLLETYAEALAYANTLFLAASNPIEALPTLGARAAEIRSTLLSDAMALANRGLLDIQPLEDLKGTNGYLNVASDVGVLVRMFRERWGQVSSKTAVQVVELDEAEQVFERITLAYAERSQEPVKAQAANDERQRAWTLLTRTYDQARRAATYIRWSEGDADKFVPSIWAGRGGRGSADASATPASPPVVGAPTQAPSPTDGAPVQPVVNGHAGASPLLS